jgi:methionine-rich copper-binding protein CopC
MRRSLPILVAAITLTVASVTAAHSLLLQSSPAAGAVVTASPPRVSLRFNNRIEKTLSRLRLVDDHGGRRDLSVASADDPPDLVTASVPRLDAGQYRVEWQVLSTDGHIVSGRFSFRVAP